MVSSSFRQPTFEPQKVSFADLTRSRISEQPQQIALFTDSNIGQQRKRTGPRAGVDVHADLPLSMQEKILGAKAENAHKTLLDHFTQASPTIQRPDSKAGNESQRNPKQFVGESRGENRYVPNAMVSPSDNDLLSVGTMNDREVEQQQRDIEEHLKAIFKTQLDL